PPAFQPAETGKLESLPPRQTWALAIGGLLMFLALRGGLVDRGGVWWSVAALGATAALWAALALWRRVETWAFAAGLCVNLAVSLPLWRPHYFDAFADWWVLLVQAN